MNTAAIRFILVGLLVLVGCGGMRAAEVPAEEAHAAAFSPRVVTYFANYPQDPTLPANLAMLADACQKGYLTHVILGLFHCDWVDRTKTQHDDPCVSLNTLYLNDPRLQPLWETVKFLQARGIKVIASFGGGGVGDYSHLLDPAQPYWYPQLRAMLKDYGMDGIDLDIEEDTAVVTTANVRALAKKLRKDFGKKFLITSAPVASAMIPGGGSVSSGVDYRKLMKQGWFDWYNLQFYNGFGDILGAPYSSTDYEAVLNANKGVSPKRLIPGVITCPSAGSPSTYHALPSLVPKLRELALKYPDFGGLYGWTFESAQVEGRTDPVGWTRHVSEALHPDGTFQDRQEEAGGTPGGSAEAAYAFHYLGEYAGIANAIDSHGDAAGWNVDYGGNWRAFLYRDGQMRGLGTWSEGGDSQALGILSGDENTPVQIVGWAKDRKVDVKPFQTVPEGLMIDVGSLGGREGAACGVSASGIVGWSNTSQGGPRAFLKAGSQPMLDLGTLGGGSSQAISIDAGGHIAGWAQTADGSWQGFTIEPGKAMAPVPFKSAPEASQLVGRMSNGKYVGWAITPVGFDAFSYDPENSYSPVEFFGTRIGAQACATGVSPSGKTVGWYLDGDGACRAFKKDDYGDIPEDLSALVADLPAGEILTIATAISDKGWIVGQTLSGRPFLLKPVGKR